MNTSASARPRTGGRIVAVVMILGAILGVIGAVRLIVYFAGNGDFFQLAIPGISVPLFAWVGWIGWGLWKGQPQFIAWAKALFALQVLVFSIGGINYEFYTGLSARISVDGFTVPTPPPSHVLTVGATFGAPFHLAQVGGNSRWTLGINFAAVAVLIYLSRISRVTGAVGDTDSSANAIRPDEL